VPPEPGNAVAKLFSACADLIWPPHSLVSDDPVDRPGRLSAGDFAAVTFLTEPLCFRCGFPLPAYVGEAAVCGACAVEEPLYDRARAAIAYGDAARTMALQLKRAGRRDGLGLYARWIAQAAEPLLRETDIIVPVPLHWRRLATRTFNQAAWLAKALSRETGLPWSPDLLVRRKPGGQAGLTAAQRRARVQGAFRAPNPKRVAGKRILLVDDVITTGATAEACARALKRAGAATVHVAALARVVEPGQLSI
jgi:ComF family protein